MLFWKFKVTELLDMLRLRCVKATFEGWIEIMASASDAVGMDQQPIRDDSRSYILFFVIFILVGSFFVLNLIVGVIIESFQKLRKQVKNYYCFNTNMNNE